MIDISYEEMVSDFIRYRFFKPKQWKIVDSVTIESIVIFSGSIAPFKVVIKHKKGSVEPSIVTHIDSKEITVNVRIKAKPNKKLISNFIRLIRVLKFFSN